MVVRRMITMIKGNLLTFTDDDESSTDYLSDYYTKYYDQHDNLISETVVHSTEEKVLSFQDDVIDDLNMSFGSKDKIDYYIMNSGLYEGLELKVGTRLKVAIILINQQLEKTTAFIDRTVLSSHLEKIKSYSLNSTSTDIYNNRIVDDFFSEVKLDNSDTSRYITKVTTTLSSNDPIHVTYDNDSVDTSLEPSEIYHISLSDLEVSGGTSETNNDQLDKLLLTVKNQITGSLKMKITEMTSK